MCAITGICGKLTGQDVNRVKRSCQRLSHRGPDACATWISEEQTAVLGHCRLSIIDTSESSNQPFLSSDQQLIVVFNGEIYNYLELREELQCAGFEFFTTGDTEVLLAAYRHWGADCLDRLNGMWAFAIWDRRRGVGPVSRLFLDALRKKGDSAGRRVFDQCARCHLRLPCDPGSVRKPSDRTARKRHPRQRV